MYGEPRDINVLTHSFPTRRSSDLIWPDMYRRPEFVEHGRFPRFYEAKDEVISNVMETNFLGADMLARRVAPLMVEQGWGRIVNVTTMFRTMTRQGASPYGASKAALECASEIWSKDLRSEEHTSELQSLMRISSAVS